MIDLPNRKLNVIHYLTQTHNEVFFEKLEQLILNKEGISKNEFVPFTIQELIKRIRNVKEGH